MSNKNISFSKNIRDKHFRFALRLLENYEDAQDVVQDVYEKIWKKKNMLYEYKSVDGLAMKITKDLCYDRLKQRKRKLDNYNESNYVFVNTTNNYDEKDLVETVKELINYLPQKQKVIIHLRDIEGCEFEEIATVMGIDITAVRMNLSRARKTIKEQIIKIKDYGL